MTRITRAISDELVEKCREELKKQGVRGENGRRLQAIISAKRHGILQVAKVYNISRETLMRWISRFKAEGSKGFAVKTGRGKPSKLSSEQLTEVQEYIAEEGARLTAKKLQHMIKERYSILISKATAYRLFNKLGFSYITPRPRHYKKDEAKQEAFKKKS